MNFFNTKVTVTTFAAACLSIANSTAQTQYVQKTIFVDSTYGNDTTGVIERSDYPVKTFAKAMLLASAGDVIEMRPGTYSYSGTVQINVSVTIKGYGAKIVTPNPASNSDRISINAPKVKIYGLEIDGGRTNESTVGSAAIIVNNVSDVVLKNCYIHDVANRCIFASGAVDRLTVEGCTLSNFYNAIQCYSTPNDCRIVGNFIKDGYSTENGSGGIKISYTGGVKGKGYEISGNNIQDAGQMGVEIWGGDNNARVLGNKIEGGVFGISMDQSHGSLVANNVVKGAAYIGIEMASGDHNQFIDNVIDGFVNDTVTTLTGFSVSNNSPKNFQFSNNHMLGCGTSIHLQDASYATLSNNDITIPSTSYGGVNVSGSQQVDIANNTINVSGLNVAPVFIDNSSGGVLEYFRIHGNNFVVANGNAWNLIVFYFGASGGITQSVVITNNTMTNSSGYLTSFINSGTINKQGVAGLVAYRQISGNAPSVTSWSAVQGGFFNQDDGNIQGPITSGGNPVAVQVAVPASATSSGTVGQMASDASYVYVCVAPNTWKRSPIASW